MDIDGVLNRASAKGSSKHIVAADLLARFERLVSVTSACVVLASTWRHEPDGLNKARELGVPFDDVLPDLRPRSRGDEVKAWLEQHPDVRRFVIIDDDDDGYGEMPLFQPNPYKGLSEDVVVAVEYYLEGACDEDLRRSLPTRAWQYLESIFDGHRG